MTGNSRSALARIGTAVLLVALVACTGDAGSTAPTQPSPTADAQTPAPQSPTGPTSPTSPPSPTPGPSAQTDNPWQYLADFPAEGAIEVSSVTATSTGFVAVGYQPMPGDGYYGQRQGLVWRSADGIAWERLVPVEFELASLDHVVLLNDQLYAFGWVSACDVVIDDPCTDIAEAGWNVWSSADGASWSRLPQAPALKTADLVGVVTGPNWLAVHGSAGDDSAAPAVWLSADGVTWEETRELAGLEQIDAMATGPHGIAAIGSNYVTSLDDIEARAARSADGRTFEPGQLPGSLPITFRSMAATEAGYVAVGHADREDQPLMAAAIASADGLAWSVAPAQEDFVNLGFQHVSAVPGGYLAIGFVPDAESFDRQLGSTWFSADGLSWTRMDDLQGGSYQHLGGAAVSGAGMIVFAVDTEEEGEDEVISTIHTWFSPLAGLAGQ